MAFDRKYSDEQRDAVWRAWREDDLSTTEISRRAKNGTLRGGEGELEAFSLPERTARDLISRRLMREVKQGVGSAGEEPLHLIVGRLITVADAEATRLVTSQQKGELDAKEFREFVRSISDLMELHKRGNLRGQEESPTGDDEEATVGGFAGKLMAEAEKEGDDATGAPSPPTPISSARPTSEAEDFQARAERAARRRSPRTSN